MKMVYVLRRKPDMTLEEFQKYWLEHHGPLVRQHAKTLGIVRYIQVHTRLPGMAPQPDPIRGQMAQAYDGVADLWFDPSISAATAEERAASARILAEDEAKFLDFSRSAVWRGEEHVMVGELPG